MGLIFNRGCSGHHYEDGKVLKVGIEVSSSGKYHLRRVVRQECMHEGCSTTKENHTFDGVFAEKDAAYEALEKHVEELE